MSFDIEPVAPLHGACAFEIHRLETRISELEAAHKWRLRHSVSLPVVAHMGSTFIAR
jgi:hypothetical protein